MSYRVKSWEIKSACNNTNIIKRLGDDVFAIHLEFKEDNGVTFKMEDIDDLIELLEELRDV